MVGPDVVDREDWLPIRLEVLNRTSKWKAKDFLLAAELLAFALPGDLGPLGRVIMLSV